MNVQQVSLQLYKDFRCIGGVCPVNCCHGWDRVVWTKAEVDKLMSAQCSEQLDKLRQTGFIPVDEDFLIDEKEQRCHFLNNDNLCSIQLELGEEYLSCTCRRYPRKNILNNGVNYYCLGLSCYEVLSQLISNEDCTKLCIELRKITNKTVFNYIEDGNVIQETPALKYRKDIMMLLYDVIADKSYSVETGITLGALAMQKISQFAEKGEADRIPEVISAIKPQIKNQAQIAKLESIKPNYLLKHALVGEIISTLVHFTNMLDNNGNPSIELYQKGEAAFAEVMRNRPFAKRNLMLGALFDLNIPCFNSKYNLYDNYCYYALYAAVINYVSATSGLTEGCEETFKVLLGRISRIYMHSTEYIRDALAAMKEHNCTSPAYLASLIK